MLVVLAGLAKAGDTPEQVKANITTAREYAEEVVAQWKILQQEDEKKYKIESFNRHIQERQETLTRLTGKIESQKSAVAEFERIAKATLGENIEKPKTNRGQEILADLSYAKSALANLEDQFDQNQKTLAQLNKELLVTESELKKTETEK